MKIQRPWTLLALAGACGVLGLKLAWPAVSPALPGCSFRRVTGCFCPGCGGTRCVDRLLGADLSGALAMNAAVVVLAALVTILLVIAVIREWRGRSPALPLLPDGLAWILTGFIIAFSVLRNLPWWPFTLLAPH